MDRDIFSNDNVFDIERRIRQLQDQVERLERGGCDARQALAELQALQSRLSRAA